MRLRSLKFSDGRAFETSIKSSAVCIWDWGVPRVSVLNSELALSMPFSDFHGNAETIHRLRDMLSRGRFPHAVILSGARGAGKYTLALMLAQALNCV